MYSFSNNYNYNRENQNNFGGLSYEILRIWWLFCFVFFFVLVWFDLVLVGPPTTTNIMIKPNDDDDDNIIYRRLHSWWWCFDCYFFFLWLVGRGFDFDFNFLCFLFSVSVFSGFFCFCFFYFHKLSMSINFICQKKCLKFHKIKFFFGFNQPEFCFVVSRFFFYLKKTQIMCVFQIRSKRPPNKFFFSLWKKNR